MLVNGPFDTRKRKSSKQRAQEEESEQFYAKLDELFEGDSVKQNQAFDSLKLNENKVFHIVTQIITSLLNVKLII